MQKQTILLALLLASLVATGVSIRAFDFARMDTPGLAAMAALSALDCLLWFLWKRAGGK